MGVGAAGVRGVVIHSVQGFPQFSCLPVTRGGVLSQAQVVTGLKVQECTGGASELCLTQA